VFFVITERYIVCCVQISIQYFSINSIIPTTFSFTIVQSSVIELAGVVRFNEYNPLTAGRCLVGQYVSEQSGDSSTGLKPPWFPRRTKDEIPNAICMETIEFLKFMVDALNAKAMNDEFLLGVVEDALAKEKRESSS